MKTSNVTNGLNHKLTLGRKPVTLGVLLTLGGFSVMATTVNRTYPIGFGNNYAGVKGNYSVSAENGKNYSKTALTANGRVNFLTNSVHRHPIVTQKQVKTIQFPRKSRISAPKPFGSI